MSGLVLRCIEAARRPRFGARFGAGRRPVSDSSSLPEDRLDRRCEDLGIIVCDGWWASWRCPAGPESKKDKGGLRRLLCQGGLMIGGRVATVDLGGIEIEVVVKVGGSQD